VVKCSSEWNIIAVQQVKECMGGGGGNYDKDIYMAYTEKMLMLFIVSGQEILIFSIKLCCIYSILDM